MDTPAPTVLTVHTTIQAPVSEVWKYYTEPVHITQWNSASPDWHCPGASNDLRVGGKFSSRMEARDGSMGFDFEGTYTDVEPGKSLAYTMGDDRKAWVGFNAAGNQTEVVVKFEAEHTNSAEMQQAGWQAILDHFKKYAESQK